MLTREASYEDSRKNSLSTASHSDNTDCTVVAKYISCDKLDSECIYQLGGGEYEEERCMLIICMLIIKRLRLLESLLLVLPVQYRVVQSSTVNDSTSSLQAIKAQLRLIREVLVRGLVGDLVEGLVR